MKTSDNVKDEFYKCLELLADCETSLLQHHVEIVEQVLLWVLGDSMDENIFGSFVGGKQHPVLKMTKYSPADILEMQKESYLQISRGNNEIHFKRAEQGT